MIENIKNYMDKYSMIQPQDHVVVGISGGADSVCLLLVLHKLSESMNFHLHPVHINHNLRGDEAKEDETFTVNLCNKLGYQCYVASVDVKKEASKKGLSTEEAGRNLRRKVLLEQADQHKSGKIALGHHMDDNVETGIFNLCRGTGIRGLSGMDPVNGQIIRPLLALRRSEIEAYLEQQGQLFCIDSSNLECEYTRNKIRNNIMPLLQSEINEKTVEHINDTMLELREIEEYMEEESNRAYTHYVKQTEYTIELSQALLSNVSPVLARSIIKKALEAMLQSPRDISRTHIRSVYELFGLQVGRSLNLPKGLRAYKSYEGVTLRDGRTLENTVKQACIELQIPGETTLSNGRVIETEILVYNDLETFQENHYTKYFDYDIIGDKLFVDMARETDYFVINEKGNTQSLKKYTRNEKIPQGMRSNLMCIRGQEEIQWLFDYRTGFKTRVSTDTKSILKIQIGGEDNGR